MALWVSLGVLDVTGTAEGATRVAMLPSLLRLAGAVALAVLAGWVLQPRTAAAGGTDSVLPLYTLGLLVLPYLPWLPDLLPVLRVLAGPLRYIVWLVVVSQVIWSSLGAGRGRRFVVRIRKWSAARLFAAVYLTTVLIFGLAALVVAPSGLFPGGDEPHYLVIAQSLLLDGDLAIENNHQRKDYRAYFDEELRPHALARGLDGALYSVHPIGLPLLIAPWFAAGGYKAVVLAMVLLAAAAAAMAWSWVSRLTASISAATFAWAATALSVSFLFSAGTVYPEIAASAAVMLVFAVGLPGPAANPRAGAPAPSAGAAFAIGCAAGALPWLSSKYSLLSAVLVAIAARRLLADPGASQTRIPRLVSVLAPYLVSVGAWLWMFHATWGSPWPSAAYGGFGQTQMSLANLPRGILGLLFDQEYGLLSYAPVLAIAATGLWYQWRAGGPERWLAAEVGLAFLVLATTVAGHTFWWGGASVPARFLVPGIPLLALPVAWEYRRAAARPDRRAMYRLLLLTGVASSAAILVSPGASALFNRRNGISRFLQWMSPDWHLWAFAPDFIGQSAVWGTAQAALCVACVVGSALLLAAAFGRSPQGSASRIGRGLAFLRANTALAVAVVLVTLFTPVALGARLKPGVQPADRARIVLLDSFDPRARPLALRYAPFSRVDAGSIPAVFDLAARPGSRRTPQPAPVLLNARFALPAGRYRVVLAPLGDAGSPPLAGSLMLQGGRHGGSLVEWRVDAAPGSAWEGLFDLPVDIGFVGFRADGPLTAAIGELRVVPATVVPMLDRTLTPEVLGSISRDGRTVALLHDGASYPEAGGFWVRGQSRASISIVAAAGRLAGPVTLRVRNGPLANLVRIITAGETTELALEPSEIREVSLAPAPADGAVRVIINPERGFVPARTEPGNRDERLLGCWVEVVG